MTPEQRKEEISKAYVHAVAAKCGFKVANYTQDDGCLDCTIASAGTLGGGTLAAPKLDLQLKCTADTSKIRLKFISWKLEREHYDKLIQPAMCPHLLVVLTLPDSEVDWIEHSPDCLIMRRCAFWCKMTGMPPTDQKSITVRLPKSQIFSPDQLVSLMEKLSKGEDI